MTITTPGAYDRLELRVVAFAGPFEIKAKDTAGNVIATHTVNILNRFIDKTISGPAIETLEFDGGGNGCWRQSAPS